MYFLLRKRPHTRINTWVDNVPHSNSGSIRAIRALKRLGHFVRISRLEECRRQPARHSAQTRACVPWSIVSGAPRVSHVPPGFRSNGCYRSVPLCFRRIPSRLHSGHRHPNQILSAASTPSLGEDIHRPPRTTFSIPLHTPPACPPRDDVQLQQRQASTPLGRCLHLPPQPHSCLRAQLRPQRVRQGLPLDCPSPTESMAEAEHRSVRRVFVTVDLCRINPLPQFPSPLSMDVAISQSRLFTSSDLCLGVIFLISDDSGKQAFARAPWIAGWVDLLQTCRRKGHLSAQHAASPRISIVDELFDKVRLELVIVNSEPCAYAKLFSLLMAHFDDGDRSRAFGQLHTIGVPDNKETCQFMSASKKLVAIAQGTEIRLKPSYGMVVEVADAVVSWPYPSMYAESVPGTPHDHSHPAHHGKGDVGGLRGTRPIRRRSTGHDYTTSPPGVTSHTLIICRPQHSSHAGVVRAPALTTFHATPS